MRRLVRERLETNEVDVVICDVFTSMRNENPTGESLGYGSIVILPRSGDTASSGQC